jgi:hypothetical protein
MKFQYYTSHQIRVLFTDRSCFWMSFFLWTRLEVRQIPHSRIGTIVIFFEDQIFLYPSFLGIRQSRRHWCQHTSLGLHDQQSRRLHTSSKPRNYIPSWQHHAKIFTELAVHVSMFHFAGGNTVAAKLSAWGFHGWRRWQQYSRREKES